MIVRDSPTALSLFLTLQGSVVPRIIGKMAFVLALTLAVILLDQLVLAMPHISLAAMSVFGVALSLFLGFRNNAAYARWWEARDLWGALIADSRNFARQLDLFDVPKPEREQLLELLAAFAHAHRGGLRRSAVQADIAGWIGPERAAALLARANPADAVLSEMSIIIAALRRSGALDGFGQLTLAKTLARLARAQAGCERIQTTPLPFVYSLLVRRTTYLYCILLPFALMDAVDWFAPVFAVVVAYVFFGLQAVTNELEHPFGSVANGLPLDALCRVIERSLCDALGREIPAPLEPVNYVLT